MCVTKIPWYSNEVRGREAIARLAGDVLKLPNVFDINVRREKETYDVIDGGYCLSIRLPGAETDKVAVNVHDMDVDIKVNNYHRCIPLPNTLRGAQIMDVRLTEDRLQIDLRPAERTEEDGKDVKQP